MMWLIKYWKPLLAVLLVVGVWGYGKYEYYQGWNKCREDFASEAAKLKKESKDAIKQEQAQADSDKSILVDYYNGLLSSRAKLPGGGVQAGDPKGVCPTSSQCFVTEEYLQFEDKCAQDAAKLVRVRQWALGIGLKAE